MTTALTVGPTDRRAARRWRLVRRRRPAAVVAVGATAVVAVDLAIKALVVAHVDAADTGPLVVTGNPSFAFGVADAPYPVMLALMVAAVALSAVLMGRAVSRGRLAPWIAAAVLGGATANLVDRAVSGVVHDYLATPWVVCNLADVALVAGIVGLALTWIWSSPPAQNLPPAPPRVRWADRRRRRAGPAG